MYRDLKIILNVLEGLIATVTGQLQQVNRISYRCNIVQQSASSIFKQIRKAERPAIDITQCISPQQMSLVINTLNSVTTNTTSCINKVKVAIVPRAKRILDFLNELRNGIMDRLSKLKSCNLATPLIGDPILIYSYVYEIILIRICEVTRIKYENLFTLSQAVVKCIPNDVNIFHIPVATLIDSCLSTIINS